MLGLLLAMEGSVVMQGACQHRCSELFLCQLSLPESCLLKDELCAIHLNGLQQACLGTLGCCLADLPYSQTWHLKHC